MTPHDHGSTVDGTAEPVLRLNGVTHRYGRRGAGAVIGPCDFSVATGTVTALVGRSGSGKSTMMNCAACLLRVTSGTVLYRGADITRLPESGRARLRRDEFGFVFQDYSLIDALTVSENMALPARISRRVVAEDHLRVVAEGLGIDSLLGRRTGELSGGQRQRVAIGRAVVNNARVLFADEPTGALDPVTRQEVLSVLLDPAVREERAVLIATHDVTLASSADRVLVIDGGRVAAVLEKPTPDGVLDALKETGDAV